MRRLSTTVLAVVGPRSADCLAWFSASANVSVVTTPALGTTEAGGAPVDPMARAQRVWRRTVRSNARFTMHDADPLWAVGQAWMAEFDRPDGADGRGRLEVTVADAVARARTDAIGLPDYYLVVDPDHLEPAATHWYLGVLHRAAPHRVVPVAAEGAVVADAIARLGAGRWWPELPVLLADLAHELPDRAMVAAPESGADEVDAHPDRPLSTEQPVNSPLTDGGGARNL